MLSKFPEQRFTARQIAEWIFENYREQCEDKRARSQATAIPLDTDEAMVGQLAGEIVAARYPIQERYSAIKSVDERPRRFYYTESTDEEEIESADAEANTPSLSEAAERAAESKKISEHDLYSMLRDYLKDELSLYSKRIDEKRSRNQRGRGGNHWLYPDVVAMENLAEDWVREISESAQHHSDKKTRLWSFEVKLKINSSNVREAFFQAVSNSSWAHFGYLVAAEIREEALTELRILSSLHGIGFIHLDTSEPTVNSQIIIPAQEKINVDWSTANRLARENTDFLAYIKQVMRLYQTGEARDSDWVE